MQHEIAIHREVEQLIAIVSEIELRDDLAEGGGGHRDDVTTPFPQRLGEADGDAGGRLEHRFVQVRYRERFTRRRGEAEEILASSGIVFRHARRSGATRY